MHTPFDADEVRERIRASADERPFITHGFIPLFAYVNSGKASEVLCRVRDDRFQLKKFTVIQSLMSPVFYGRVEPDASGGTSIVGGFGFVRLAYVFLALIALLPTIMAVSFTALPMPDGMTLTVGLRDIVQTSLFGLTMLGTVTVVVTLAQAGQKGFVIEFLKRVLDAQVTAIP